MQVYKSTSRGSGIGCTERKVVVAAENTVMVHCGRCTVTYKHVCVHTNKTSTLFRCSALPHSKGIARGWLQDSSMESDQHQIEQYDTQHPIMTML